VPGLLERTANFLADRLDRRGFLGRAAMAGSAAVVAPVAWGLRPTSAYAAVCNCSGSACACGSLCCDGYTEFCCTLTGANACPPGTITAGWWKVDGSQFCGGAARYYLDCNAQCGTCGCGGNGVCSGACSGTRCGCARGSCNNRKAGCTRFRYGQCNQQIPCVGPIVCRVVTCAQPWAFDPACGTSSRTDNATRWHDRPCLNEPFGSIDVAVDRGGAIRVAGWAVANSNYDRAGIRVHFDEDLVHHGVAEVPRSDVRAIYPQFNPFTGYDVTIPTTPGRRLVCVWGVDRRNGRTALLGMRHVDVAPPSGNVESIRDVGGAVRVSGWAVANSSFQRAGIRVFRDTDFVYHGAADLPRPDVKARHPSADPNTGFDVTLPTPPGRRLICVWGVDRRTGGLGLLRMAEIEVAARDLGALESAAVLPDGSIRFVGWAHQLSRPRQATTVRVTADGVELARSATTVRRDDIVGRVWGAHHSCGYSLVVAGQPGTKRYCVEIVGASATTSLGCANRTIASPAPPADAGDEP